ncbi:MAG: S1 RNA-binding domain-containing protein, partial [Candidatus Eremiobacteraeota bacterium]|nr:S1 RNA-binding domain-containing protein [Candidatus Eremiobacteraeota bacterium]
MDEQQMSGKHEEQGSSPLAITTNQAFEGAGTGSSMPDEGMTEVDVEKTVRKIQAGDRVTGRVIKVEDDGIMVDVGYKSEGIIPASEFSSRHSDRP